MATLVMDDSPLAVEEMNMAKGSSIRGKGSSDTSGNDSYIIDGRGIVPRNQLVKEVEAGKHPDTHVIQVKGEKYLRNNPNSSGQDNINKKSLLGYESQRDP